MTRDEAINLIADMDSDKYTAREAVALTMAIKALEAPHNDNWEGYSSRLWKSAYERGKADAEAEQVSALGKIKEEIERTRKIYLDMNDIDWLNGCDYVLAVIDKYRESEDNA